MRLKQGYCFSRALLRNRVLANHALALRWRRLNELLLKGQFWVFYWVRDPVVAHARAKLKMALVAASLERAVSILVQVDWQRDDVGWDLDPIYLNQAVVTALHKLLWEKFVRH